MGLGFGDNTEAAFNIKGIRNTALGVKIGGIQNFQWPIRNCDLIVTYCKHSRNRRAGVLIGKATHCI